MRRSQLSGGGPGEYEEEAEEEQHKARERTLARPREIQWILTVQFRHISLPDLFNLRALCQFRRKLRK